MRPRPPIEILEDLAHESDSIYIKQTIALVVSQIKAMEAERMEMRYRQIAVLKGIKLLASWHYDAEANFDDLSPDDQVAHVNARIVLECDQALRELGASETSR